MELHVTDVPGSKPDQKYAGRRDRQNYIRENKEQVRTRSERIPLCVRYIGTMCRCRLKVIIINLLAPELFF